MAVSSSFVVLNSRSVCIVKDFHNASPTVWILQPRVKMYSFPAWHLTCTYWQMVLLDFEKINCIFQCRVRFCVQCSCQKLLRCFDLLCCFAVLAISWCLSTVLWAFQGQTSYLVVWSTLLSLHSLFNVLSNWSFSSSQCKHQKCVCVYLVF